MAHSWGGGSDVGAIADRPMAAVVEHLEFGVQHPSIREGGMDHPDQQRRDAGLPVPTPQKGRSGHIVDLVF